MRRYILHDAYLPYTGTVFGTGSSLIWLHCRAHRYVLPYGYVEKVETIREKAIQSPAGLP